MLSVLLCLRRVQVEFQTDDYDAVLGLLVRPPAPEAVLLPDGGREAGAVGGEGDRVDEALHRDPVHLLHLPVRGRHLPQPNETVPRS